MLPVRLRKQSLRQLYMYTCTYVYRISIPVPSNNLQSFFEIPLFSNHTFSSSQSIEHRNLLSFKVATVVLEKFDN